ncbi:MAG TPA: DUF2279 domain-containing protein [Methylomirabilota bacterium]|jgi:hypothetical protein
MGSLGLCIVMLLAGHGRLAAQDGFPSLAPAAADCAAPSETAYHLLPDKFDDYERWLTLASLETDVPMRLELGRPRPAPAPPSDEPAFETPPCPTHRLAAADSTESPQRVSLSEMTAQVFPRGYDRAETEVPRWSFLERHRVLFSTLIPVTAIAAVTANSLIAYDTNHPFRIHHEGFFGKDTVNGGADKASHLTDYYVITSLFEDAYKMLGYSDNAALAWGAGLAFATGLANEVSDGFTRHGFSWEDLAMDSAGVFAAGVLSLTHTRDLIGLRTSHLPSSTYTHDVYSLDFKFSGLSERLGVKLGPLRWLLFSVTYNAKGYRVNPAEEHQRQVGFEIGLNLQQILFDLKVPRSTWWGYPLHVVADNVRFPYTALGVRVDLNHGKWSGPNAGNFD